MIDPATHVDTQIPEVTNVKCIDTLELKNICDQQNTSSPKIKSLLLNPWSISSLSKFDNFKELADYLDQDLDIMVLPKSWLQESTKNLYNIPGYSALHSCRGDVGKGGVSLYYKRNHTLIDYETIYDHNCNIIRATLQMKGSKYTILAVYRPPPLTNLNMEPFLNRLESLFESFKTHKCIMLGDLNIHPTRNERIIKQYMELLECYDFDLCNTEVTRESSQTILDHVCSNFCEETSMLILTCPLTANDALKSDHSIVMTIFEATEKLIVNEVRLITRLNHREINKQLEWRHTRIF